MFLLALVGSVLATYYRYFIKKDFYIEAETECDPRSEACFIYVCDPESEEDCPEEEAERISYYKLIKKKASAIPLCDPSDAACDALDCSDSRNCEVLFCDPEASSEEEEIVCSLPDEYNAQYPEAAVEELELEDETVVEENSLDGAAEEEKIDSVEEVEDTAESGTEAETVDLQQEMPS